MRYGPIPTRLVEHLALLAGDIPLPMLDALLALVKARSLMAAVELDVIGCLRERTCTADEVASARQLDRDSAYLLLRVLAFSGYVRQRGNAFGLTRLGRSTLLPEGRNSSVDYLRWNYTQWKYFDGFEHMLTAGHGRTVHDAIADWPSYLGGMLEIARRFAPLLARSVPVSKGATTLIDIAGAHGLFGEAIAKRHRSMRATVLELPDAVPHARAIAERHGIDVDHQVCDVLADAIPPADVALIANLVHHLDVGSAASLVHKTCAALRPGGTIAVWELELPPVSVKADFTDAIALYFRLTSGSRCYRGEEIAAWFAGCESIRIKRFVRAPGYVLVTGRAPQS
ncbi:MAG: hypothetical protein H7Z43_04455 [Clostridia bacterium]|nr:hypothetical protein [Deltaproteobacteria bacterium]